MSLDDLTDEERALRERLIADADEHGSAVVEVAGDEHSGPFCFTVGAWRRFGVPEAIVIGLPVGTGKILLDAYVRRAAAGERFLTGVRYKDFFEGVPVVLERVDKGHYFEYFGSAFLVYPKGDFPAVQLIVPTPEVVWPWHPHAPEGFARWQPILTESGRPQSWTPGVNGP
ncbi:MAG: DUF4262 domain-containing protein [Actinophytocola sp.]|uniref:DUF4262 domain-containing protein n=1 Tax=Actinophytocola sp. TaxID=1872138 RepID=UPI00132BE4BE|nr:DUF4262 domain-containing protein [Actinophytocola sp.]MPZ80095.1 DUF4262 domain-containing protein [Actinophytocola sp.]